MSEDIKNRLKTTSEACIACYDVWSGNQKDAKARASLQEAIHELRKVASRLEIDLAISERDQNAAKPLPIPPHRDARKPRAGNAQQDGGSEGGNDDGQEFTLNVERRTSRRPNRPQGGAPKKEADGNNAGNAAPSTDSE